MTPRPLEITDTQNVMPKRIQRSRAKGWRMPEGAIYVGRPSKWGNPWISANTGMVDPVLRFACETAPLLDVTPLIGKDLVCWCPLNADCHADVLLELAADLEADLQCKAEGNAVPRSGGMKTNDR